jgi:hypothetical protein
MHDNFTYIIPTIKKKEFYINWVMELVYDKFHTDFEFEIEDMIDDTEIISDAAIYDRRGNYICNIFMDGCVHTLPEKLDDELSFYKSVNNNEFINLLTKLKNEKIDGSICFLLTQCENEIQYRKKIALVNFLQKHYKAYILDDSIHPEFIKNF